MGEKISKPQLVIDDDYSGVFKKEEMEPFLNDIVFDRVWQKTEAEKDKKAELEKDAEMELEVDKEMELDVDRSQSLREEEEREVRLQKYLENQKELEKLKNSESLEDKYQRYLDNQKELERLRRQFDIPDMREITPEPAPEREINIISGVFETAKPAIEPATPAAPVSVEASTEPKPLSAIGIDWSESEEKLAQKAAKADLKKELRDSGIIKRIWKGKLFRDYYEDKYTTEYLEGKRTDRKGKTIAEAIKEQKRGLIKDLTGDAVKEISQINQKDWDENGFIGSNGERFIPVEEGTNNKIRETIEEYARLMVEADTLSNKDKKIDKDIESWFKKEINHIIKKAKREGKITSDLKGNNYLDVAKQAYERYQEAIKNVTEKVEQDAAMANVMAGFRAYNVETTKSFTVSHKSDIEKIRERIESQKANIEIPEEIISQAIEQQPAIIPEPELESNIIPPATNPQTAEQAPAPTTSEAESKPEPTKPETEPEISETEDSVKEQEDPKTILKHFKELMEELELDEKSDKYKDDSMKIKMGLLERFVNEIAIAENMEALFPDANAEGAEYVKQLTGELRDKQDKEKEINSKKEAAIKEYEDFLQYLTGLGISESKDPKLYVGLKQKLDNKLAIIEDNPTLPDTPEQKYVDDFLEKFKTSDEEGEIKVSAREAEQFKKQSHEQWEKQTIGELSSKLDLIGGGEGLSIIISKERVTDPRFRERCRTWWDNLSDDGKQFIRRFVEETDKEDHQYHNTVEWSRALRYLLPDIDK